jgi:plastocyanin
LKYTNLIKQALTSFCKKIVWYDYSLLLIVPGKPYRYCLPLKLKIMKRIKFILPAILAGIICVMISSCSKSDVDNPPAADLYKVNILATQFDPATMTMLPGARITWTNMDAQVHSIVSDDATSFNSGNIPAGGSFSFTPTVTGTYTYHCGQHPGVQGTLNVVTR